jgi:hypothetical protein
MKKRLIVCLFISIYLIYTHKNSLLINLKEVSFIKNLYQGLSYSSIIPTEFDHIPTENHNVEQKRKIPFFNLIIFFRIRLLSL